MSKKELVVANSNAVATVAEDFNSWGDNQMTASDLVIPKILAMQGLSKFVMDGVAKFGDFCDSLSGEVLGGIGKPIEFVPFHMDKIWIISKKKGNKFEYNSVEPVTPETENLPWEDTDADGTPIKRDYVRVFYVNIPGRPMPYMLSFKGTSAKTGKILATQMYSTNRMSKMPPAGVVMTLDGIKSQNDHGTFVVMNVKASRKAEPEELATAYEWYKTVSKHADRFNSMKEESEPAAPASNAAY
jgi:hypothetical protein